MHGHTMSKAPLRAHLEAALAFSGVMVVLAGALGAGLSLLVGTGGMLSALRPLTDHPRDSQGST